MSGPQAVCLTNSQVSKMLSGDTNPKLTWLWETTYTQHKIPRKLPVKIFECFNMNSNDQTEYLAYKIHSHYHLVICSIFLTGCD